MIADKTVMVSVERQAMHPVYKKFIKRSKKYAAHDEDRTVQSWWRCENLDRPISKSKNFGLLLLITL